MRETSRIRLRCSVCGHEGEARLSEMDGWGAMQGDRSVYVEDITPGFRIVERPTSSWQLDILCLKDGVTTLPDPG